MKESSHHLVDILATTGPSRVTLPLNEAIMDLVKGLWQTSTFLLPTSKRAQGKYYIPAQVMSSFTPIPGDPGSIFWQ